MQYMLPFHCGHTTPHVQTLTLWSSFLLSCSVAVKSCCDCCKSTRAESLSSCRVKYYMKLMLQHQARTLNHYYRNTFQLSSRLFKLSHYLQLSVLYLFKNPFLTLNGKKAISGKYHCMCMYDRAWAREKGKRKRGYAHW